MNAQALPSRMTAAEYRHWRTTGQLPVEAQSQPAAAKTEPVAQAKPGRVSKGSDGMNKLERAYSVELENQRLAGLISSWKFEAMKLRLANRTTYSPDFFVVLPDGRMEHHETKGFMRDDAHVKLKVAASQFPMFTFRLVKRKAGAWIITEVKR
jgi:hypothetical protein